MQRKFVGQKYESGKYLSATEISANIRADLKAAVKEGKLPALKFSVRKEDYAGGRSVTVEVKGLPEGVTRYKPEFLEFRKNNPGASRHEFYSTFGSTGDIETPEYKAIVEKVKEIANAYNYDNSDPMTDYFHVNYYLHLYVDGNNA